MITLWLLACADGFFFAPFEEDPEPIEDPGLFLEGLLDEFCPLWVECQATIPAYQEPVMFDSTEDCVEVLFPIYLENIANCSFDATMTPDCIDGQASQTCDDVGYPIDDCATVFTGPDCGWFHLTGAF
ncbi:MAG: hypothetical protein AAGA48_06820 [Myxococcota bacterium]